VFGLDWLIKKNNLVHTLLKIHTHTARGLLECLVIKDAMPGDGACVDPYQLRYKR
jgi:hypothetical protein